MRTIIVNYAHRGNSCRLLENTMDAFDSAFKGGATGIELDVQMTKDGEIVIVHDFTLERLAGLSKRVTECTRSELEDVKLTDLRDHRTYRIPSLHEYLAWVQAKDLMTNIEFKVPYKSPSVLEEKTIELVENYELKDKVIFSSFQPDSLKRAQAIDESLSFGFLFNRKTLEAMGLPYSIQDIQSLFEILQRTGVEYVHPYHDLVNKVFVNLAEVYQLKINTWTVNDTKTMDTLLALDISGIITDDPEVLKPRIEA